MSEDERKLTRRLFLTHSAMTASVAGVVVMTDALIDVREARAGDGNTVIPYSYSDE